ncbi:MAG: hypothetical protein M8353_09785 [ANME-2 cluster archaeon]|nr:hypothetical protein [ANME-2 cluster archaeon]
MKRLGDFLEEKGEHQREIFEPYNPDLLKLVVVVFISKYTAPVEFGWNCDIVQTDKLTTPPRTNKLRPLGATRIQRRTDRCRDERKTGAKLFPFHTPKSYK